MSSKWVYQKLRMKEGSSVLVLNSTGDYEKLIGRLPRDTDLLKAPQVEVDFVHLFVSNRDELEQNIDIALKAVKYDGLLWISYPKGSSGVETDINRDSIW